MLVFARVDLVVVPLLWARSWILQPVAGMELEKGGSLPILVYLRPPIEFRCLSRL